MGWNSCVFYDLWIETAKILGKKFKKAEKKAGIRVGNKSRLA